MSGPELKTWRERRGWTQMTAAQELGVSLSSYQRAERNGPRDHIAKHVARIQATYV